MINMLTGNQAGIGVEKAERLGNDPQRRRPDITRAKELLGWEPVVSLREGLEKTIPYFQKKLGL
jgi:dTDP-glucose 4,6-dehydratase